MTEERGGRKIQASVDNQFPERWSPRAFSTETISDEMLVSLFEAARWAPSCANEQPWLFLYAVSEEDRNVFLNLLAPGNRRWAGQAPVLLFLLARRTFAKGGEPNRHHGFDAGAAWMSLALQARKMDLHTHAMAGFDEEKAYEVLGVPKEEYEIMAAIALGKVGERSDLPEDLARREFPSDRKPLHEVARRGPFNKG
jgi:nitroreductase